MSSDFPVRVAPEVRERLPEANTLKQQQFRLPPPEPRLSKKSALRAQE